MMKSFGQKLSSHEGILEKTSTIHIGLTSFVVLMMIASIERKVMDVFDSDPDGIVELPEMKLGVPDQRPVADNEREEDDELYERDGVLVVATMRLRKSSDKDCQIYQDSDLIELTAFVVQIRSDLGKINNLNFTLDKIKGDDGVNFCELTLKTKIGRKKMANPDAQIKVVLDAESKKPTVFYLDREDVPIIDPL